MRTNFNLTNSSVSELQRCTLPGFSSIFKAKRAVGSHVTAWYTHYCFNVMAWKGIVSNRYKGPGQKVKFAYLCNFGL